MKAFLVSVYIVWFSVCVLGEGEWTHPSTRDGFLERAMPTLEDIPDRRYGVQYSFVEFEGCEFYPNIWGSGRNAEKIVTYWAQFRLRSGFPEYLKGTPGQWRLCVGLRSLGPTTDNSWSRDSLGVFGMVIRTF